MADYGVNIAVAVKNSQAVTQLSNKLKDTAARIEEVNSHFNALSNITGKVLPGSIANFNKALADAAKNLSDVALNTEDAVTAAREFVQAQNAANAALKERDRLVKKIRLEGETVSATPFGPMPAKDFTAERGQSLARAKLLAIESKKEAAAATKIFQVKRDFADEIHRITMDLDRKARNAEIDNIIEQYRIENELQDNLFKRAIKSSEKRAKEFMEELGLKKNAELSAIAEIDKARKKSAGEAVRLTGQTSPIGGAVGTPGSPAALRAAEQAQRLRSASSSALIGGAFPLLFGQGLGAAGGGLIGGFGGGMIGGEFGFGVSLIGTQIGSMIDQLGQRAIDLGRALDPLTANTEAVIDAVGKADTEFALLVKELEAAGRTAEALQLVTDELEKVVGEDGVEAIELFSAGIRGLQNDFTVFITQVAAVVAQAINDLTGQTKQIQEIREVGKIVQEARKSDDPRIKAAIAELDAIPEFQVDEKAQEKRVSTRKKIAELVTRIAAEDLKASRDAIARAATEEKRLTTLVQSDKVARETRYLLAAQIQLEEAGSDLLDEKVVAARERVIQEQYLAAYRQAEGSEQGQLLAGDQRRLALLELDNDIAAARTKETERLAREAQKTTKEINTQITQALTLEQKFAAELKQREATTELEADKARIAAEFEDRMRRIEKIGDDTLTKEAQRLANQIKITDEAQAEANARLRSLQAVNALKDSQAGFQMKLETLRANAPGAFSGPFAGSERADFLGGLEMQLELERRNREIETMQGRVAAGKADQEDVDNLVALRDQYELYQTQILEATVAQQKFADALALTQPVTDSLFDSLLSVADGTKSAQEAFADFLRNIASMLADMASQMIAQYIAIGIARMFAGLPKMSSGQTVDIAAVDAGIVNSLGGLNFGGYMADGGQTAPGNAYVVGERGPELFVPGAQGNIIPNDVISPNPAANFDKVIELNAPTFEVDVVKDIELAAPAFDVEPFKDIEAAAPNFKVNPIKDVELAAPSLKVNPIKDIELAAPSLKVDGVKEVQLAAPSFKLDPVEEIQLAAPSFELDPVKKIELAAPAFNVDPPAGIQSAAPAFDVDPLKDIEVAPPKFVFGRVKDIELAAPNLKLDPVKDIKLATPKFELDSSPDFNFNSLPTPVFDHIPKFDSNFQPDLQFDPPAPRSAQTFVSDNAMSGANVTVNVDASGSSVEGNADQASQLGKAIGIAVQQELVKQKRPGGLLAR